MIDQTPLAPAVKGDKEILSQDVLAEIYNLNGPRPLPFSVQLLFAWLVIIGTISWAVWMQTAWATILAIVVVATRHNVLGLLVHDQAHRLGFKGKYADLFVNLFAAYPLIVLTVEDYAQVHLAHHRDYFTEKDPDYLRKSGPDWSFPMKPSHLAKLFLMDLCGINTIKLIRGKKESPQGYAFKRPFQAPKWVRPLYFAIVIAVLTVTGAWPLFLLYWLLPIATLSQVIVRWGAICEHKYNLPNASVAESTPLIVLSWWERLLLPNLNFAMHPYHHYFPGIAFSNLPKVHEIYLRQRLLNEQNVFHGYLAYFKSLIKFSPSV